jgi:chemotaxis protein methyltransferase CheR
MISSSSMAEIRPREFELLQRLIESESGIQIKKTKQAFLVSRLRCRLQVTGLDSFGEYYQYVSESPEERQVMIDRICTHETRFFREPFQFDFLKDEIFSRWQADVDAGRRERRIRAWSAGCSTGEEPFSLAMLLRKDFPICEGWRIEIQATDISRHVLKQAASATWPIDRATEIPEEFLDRFMLRGVRGSEGQIRAVPELRSMIQFSKLKLNDPHYALSSKFDLIMCRNVMIYFPQEVRAQAIDRLVDQLVPGGLLFVGHAETLHGSATKLQRLAPTIYARSSGRRGSP